MIILTMVARGFVCGLFCLQFGFLIGIALTALMRYFQTMKILSWGLGVCLVVSMAANGWLWVKKNKVDRKYAAIMYLQDSLSAAVQENSEAQQAVIAGLVGRQAEMGKAGRELIDENLELASKFNNLSEEYDRLFKQYGELLYASQDVIDHNKSLIERLRLEYASNRELTKAAAFNQSLSEYTRSADIVRELQGIRFELRSANIWR